jgi:hypothetical protein
MTKTATTKTEPARLFARLPHYLKMGLDLHAVRTDQSIQEVTAEALEAYLPREVIAEAKRAAKAAGAA